MNEFKNSTEYSSSEIAKPFVVTTIDLFETEFSMPVHNQELIALEQTTKVNTINFISHLSGAFNAHIIFSFEKSLAKKLLDSFPYAQYEDHMQEMMMIESVAEFLNLVIGNTMGILQDNSVVHFSPPLAITGQSTLYEDKNANTYIMKLVLEDGEMLLIFRTNTKAV